MKITANTQASSIDIDMAEFPPSEWGMSLMTIPQ